MQVMLARKWNKQQQQQKKINMTVNTISAECFNDHALNI